MPSNPSSDGPSPISSSLSRGATGPAIPTSSSRSTCRIRLTWPRGPRASNPRRVARFPIVGQITEPVREFHPPTTSVTVQAIYDAESIALLVRWHDMSAQKTGKNGPSLPVPLKEEEESAQPAGSLPSTARARSRLRRTRKARRPVARRGSARQQPAKEPVRGGSGTGRPGIRVLRCRRGPDSVAGADRRPQALLHLRRRPELGRSLVLRPGPPRSPSVHRPGKRRHRAQRHGRSHRCRELRPGRMVGHLQAAPSRNLGRPVLARRVPADRLLGLGRVVARARQPARSHGLVLLYVEPEMVPSAVGPMVQTALFILVIELAVIGWVRWRYGSRAQRGIGGEPRRAGSHQSVSCRGPSGESDVQEHLRSRR